MREGGRTLGLRRPDKEGGCPHCLKYFSLFFLPRHFLNRISVDFFFRGVGGCLEMMHLSQTTSTDYLLWVRLNFNCPKPFLSTKCKLCIVSSYNYNIWPTQNEKKKNKTKKHVDKLKGPRSIPQRLSVHYAFVDLQQRRQWCKDFKRQVLTKNLTKKKKMTTKDTLSRCHWMCFMSNKRDPLSEVLVPLALCFYSDELPRREEAF